MAISTPSMRIRPPALSRIRNKAKANDDLPAPVRPTMPICREENNGKMQQINELMIKTALCYYIHSGLQRHACKTSAHAQGLYFQIGRCKCELHNKNVCF